MNACQTSVSSKRCVELSPNKRYILICILQHAYLAIMTTIVTEHVYMNTQKRIEIMRQIAGYYVYSRLTNPSRLILAKYSLLI